MKILVTGAAGFIGSHLCEALLASGHRVVALDDCSGGSWDNLAEIREQDRLIRIQGSVLDRAAVEAAMDGCTEVYHFAAVLGVQQVFTHPVRTIETNVQGTATVLEAARARGCPVLIASTSEVYGRGTRQRPFTEDDEIVFGTSLRWGYAASKAVDEHLARGYYKEYGLPTVVVRYFNVVGPRQNMAYGAVVPQFVTQALHGEPLTVYGDGTQVRSFTWIDDAVRATMALVACPEAFGEIFNIGSENALQIRELAQRVKDLTGSDAPIVYQPYEQVYGPGFEDIRYRVPDISKARQTIQYVPAVDLEGILRRMIELCSDTGRGMR